MAREPLNGPVDARDDELTEDGELIDLEARETLAADAVPELDTASADEDIERSLEAHATEDIVGDADGDDYRAGTLDPEGTDRGPWRELTGDRLDDRTTRDARGDADPRW